MITMLIMAVTVAIASAIAFRIGIGEGKRQVVYKVLTEFARLESEGKPKSIPIKDIKDFGEK